MIVLEKINYRADLEILNAGHAEIKVTYHLIVLKKEITITTEIEDLEWIDTQITRLETITTTEEEICPHITAGKDHIETLITEILIEEEITTIQDIIQERDRDHLSARIITGAREADRDLMNIRLGVGAEEDIIIREEVIPEKVALETIWAHTGP